MELPPAVLEGFFLPLNVERSQCLGKLAAQVYTPRLAILWSLKASLVGDGLLRLTGESRNKCINRKNGLVFMEPFGVIFEIFHKDLHHLGISPSFREAGTWW